VQSKSDERLFNIILAPLNTRVRRGCRLSCMEKIPNFGCKIRPAHCAFLKRQWNCAESLRRSIKNTRRAAGPHHHPPSPSTISARLDPSHSFSDRQFRPPAPTTPRNPAPQVSLYSSTALRRRAIGGRMPIARPRISIKSLYIETCTGPCKRSSIPSSSVPF
jgi:hypothetical protein